jgi:DNA-binding NtrC family response regulator
MTEDRKKHSVLIVDDEPDILFSLRGLLRREFDLHTAESGSEALKVLAERSIQVVMTDQRMPEMTGVELLDCVKAKYPDTIRMVFTGYADIKAVVDGINTGGLFRYITKPWDPDDLIALLHEAARHYDDLVERRRILIDLRSFLADHQNAESQSAPQSLDRRSELMDRLDRLIRRDADDP